MARDKRRDLRAYRNKVTAAKYRAKHSDKPTLCWICQEPIDLDLNPSDKYAFTLDHQEALANGGHIINQILLPAHRCCNSARQKGDKVDGLAGRTREW